MHIISPDDIKRDPAKEGALDANGNLLVLDASFWHQFNQAEISVFCVKNGLYNIPTTELVDWLKTNLSDASALEIGAGNGVMAKAINIRATDNWMQTWPQIKEQYAMTMQATVKYGKHVEKIDAIEAIRKYKPQVVLAAWVTHKWNPAQPEREGNQWGVPEQEILAHSKYIHIGNRHVHRHKPILNLPHQEIEAPWLISRAMNGSPNLIYVWDKN